MYSVYLILPTQRVIAYQNTDIRKCRSSMGQIFYKKHHQRIATEICDSAGNIVFKKEAKFK